MSLPLVRLTELLFRDFPHLRGPFVYLRRSSHKDSVAWISLRKASKDFLQPWEPLWDDQVLTSDGFIRFKNYHRDGWRDGHLRGFLIFRNENEDLLGGITLSNIRYGVNMSASVGYWVGAPHARKGYMQEALILAMDYAFLTLHLNRIEASCMPDNRPSSRILLKSGFTIEGEARAYLHINGVWEDHLLFALLARDKRPRLPDL